MGYGPITLPLRHTDMFVYNLLILYDIYLQTQLIFLPSARPSTLSGIGKSSGRVDACVSWSVQGLLSIVTAFNSAALIVLIRKPSRCVAAHRIACASIDSLLPDRSRTARRRLTGGNQSVQHTFGNIQSGLRQYLRVST